jgi:hypothetical protein
MAKTINLSSVEPGTIIQVRGKVAFSRVRSQIKDDELRRTNERNRLNGRLEIDKAHTKLSLKNCTLVVKDPNNLTMGERYVQERMFLSQKHPENGYCYEGLNKGKYLPVIAHRVPDDPTAIQQYEPSELLGELANDLDVTVLMRVFASKPNNGITLDTIIVNEPIRFYQGGAATSLANAGLTLRASSAGRELAASAVSNGPVPSESAGDAPVTTPVQAPPAGSDPYSSGNAAVQGANGFTGMNAPQSQAVNSNTPPVSANSANVTETVATAPVAAPVAANPDAAYDRNATANGQQSEEGIRYYG